MILIVDDDLDVCRLLEFKLKATGYDSTALHDGREALDYVEKHNPDLILLDAMLPGFDGFYVLREIRKENRSVPIIMLTAKGQENDVLMGLEDGANDYLTKPFSPAEVVLRCKRWLG